MTTPRTRVVVADIADIPLGEAFTVTRGEAPPISIFHTEDGLFAIDDTCTHQDASLADGWVENCMVECPLHEACFDLRTGAPSGPPAKVPVRVHPVGIDGGQVWLEVDP